MYHCHVRCYLVGHQRETFGLIREMQPAPRFTYEFAEGGEPEQALAAWADVIFADLRGMDLPGALAGLLERMRPEAECILMAEREQLPLITALLPQVRDLWLVPMGEEELGFRLLRWQQGYRAARDAWETSQFLEATINSVPNMIWYKDKDGIHEKVNDSFCRVVEKTKEQVQGRGHAYIWNVEHDDPACIESEREVMRRRATCVAEEQVRTGEGDRLLTTYKSPLYDLDGSVMGTVGVAIDITRERAYEQEIITKNQTLEAIFTTMDAGVLIHSLDGSHILSVNQAALEILGYDSQEELLADGFYQVASTVAEEDKQRLQDAISSLEEAGDSVNVEYKVCHKDGRLIQVMGSFKLIQRGGELFCQRFLLDCTAQKQREEAEREEDRRRQMELIRALSVDYSVACYYDLDTGRGFPLRMEEEDPSFGEIFCEGRTFDESRQLYIQQFVCPEDRGMVEKATSREKLTQVLEKKKICHINYRILYNGETRYFQMKAVRTDNGGVVLGFRSVDEETRRDMEKTALLENALLQANRASKAKSEFLSNMSHDIRTPMNAIVGFTTLAITHIERRDQVEEYLKKIMTSGNHLLSLINDILDMSRIESGKIHLDEELCSLPDILHSLHNIVQADIRAKQLDLFIDAVDVLDEDIYCDKLRLNQVLLNLLGNAIKYTGSGGTVSVRIIERRKNAPAGYANYEFHVKDTGIGMSKEFVSHIFEPFERERNSTISGIQGTGLGMAITKNIVDMMNGIIEVKSEQGVGSEFIVTFPMRLHSGEKVPQTIPRLTGCRALVVDDDFNTCDSVSYMLQQMGLRAEWTMSGREAVLRSRQAVDWGDCYSVYIIDWLMPDMNGIEVARRIRKETGEDVPIIVLTAYDWSDIEEEAREAGVSAFCSKPLFLSELRKCLCTVIADPSEEKEEPAKKPVQLHTGRILLAEDNELNQEIAVAILGDAGFTVEIAANGQIAVDMLERSEPGYYRLVLMDIQMPVMGGYEATKAIRSMPNRELASIPILAMTANAFEEDKKEALSCGMNGHIAKPIDVEKLIETLEKILN